MKRVASEKSISNISRKAYCVTEEPSTIDDTQITTVAKDGFLSSPSVKNLNVSHFHKMHFNLALHRFFAAHQWLPHYSLLQKKLLSSHHFSNFPTHFHSLFLQISNNDSAIDLLNGDIDSHLNGNSTMADLSDVDDYTQKMEHEVAEKVAILDFGAQYGKVINKLIID